MGALFSEDRLPWSSVGGTYKRRKGANTNATKSLLSRTLITPALLWVNSSRVKEGWANSLYFSSDAFSSAVRTVRPCILRYSKTRFKKNREESFNTTITLKNQTFQDWFIFHFSQLQCIYLHSILYFSLFCGVRFWPFLSCQNYSLIWRFLLRRREGPFDQRSICHCVISPLLH